MTSHVDESVVAAYAEGLLRPRKRGRVASHLAACRACSRTLEQLADVSALLSAAPAPPTPAGLPERLAAALAAETARSAGAGRGAGRERRAQRERATAGGGRRRPTAPRAARLAAAAAAVALIGGVGYAISQSVSLSAQGGSSASAGSMGRPAPAQGAGAPRAASQAEPGAGALLISSGTSYQPATLGSQAKAVLARQGAHGENSPTGSQHLASGTPEASGYAACAASLAPGQRIVLVDLAHYRGRPVAVIVTRAGGADTAWVVARGCSGPGARPIARAAVPR